jgi:predicted transcriptional regulator
MTTKYKHVLNALNYLEAEGIVEKIYKHGETYYNLTKEGAKMEIQEKPRSKKSLKLKKALLLIK